ncbi:MAG: PEP-CTERM system TPR-repeat protein PrsT [Chromatiaceae bacterium]|nr:PEP-CTERM system TPR-repeat protein PrsT [Chromatiaceae bacterium]
MRSYMGKLTVTLFIRSIVLFFILGSQVLLANTAVQSTSASVGRFYEDALQRFAQEDYRSAAIILKNALQQDSTHLPSRILLGRAYLADNLPVQAEAEFQLARKLGADRGVIDPLLAESFLLLGKYHSVLDEIGIDNRDKGETVKLKILRGKAYLGLNEPDKAMVEFEEASRLDPDAAGPIMGKAQVHLLRGETEAARPLLTQAVSLDSANSEAWMLKSQLSQTDGDKETAVAELGKVLEIDAEHNSARTRRAALLIDLARLAEAQQEIDLLQASTHVDPLIDYLQAKIHFLRGDVASAHQSLSLAGEAIEKIPPELRDQDVRLLLLAGSVHFAAGNLEKASSHLQQLLARWPDNLAARMIMTRILLARDQPDNAKSMLAPVLEQAPEDPMVQMLTGQIHLGEQDYIAATKIFDRLTAQRPDDAWLQINLAQSLIATDQVGAAIETLGSIGQQGKQGVTAGFMLALLNMQLGKFDAAAAAAERVVALEPENLSALNLLGNARLAGADFQGARSAFEHALEIDPTFLAAILNLGRVEAGEGNLDLARKRYQKLLDVNPGQVETLVAYSQLEESHGNLDGAIRWREKLRSFQPDAIEPNLKLVELYLSSGKSEQALTVVQELSTNHPDDDRVTLALAVAQIASGQDGLAKVTLINLARKVSYEAKMLYRIAALQKQIGDLNNAQWSLLKAVEGDPGWLPAKMELGLVSIALNKLDEALDLALQLQIERPNSFEGHFLEGEVLFKEKNMAAAERAYSRAQKILPDPVKVLRLYQIHRFRGHPAEATSLLQDWIKHNPEDQLVKQTLAEELVQRGKYDEAREIYRQLLVKQPENPSLLNNLAMLYQMAGDPRALEMARKAVDLAPKDPYVVDTLGWILVSSGNPQEGLLHLREARSRNANLPDITYHLALALHALGRDGEARDELTTLMRSKKEFPDRAAAEQLLQQLSR